MKPLCAKLNNHFFVLILVEMMCTIIALMELYKYRNNECQLDPNITRPFIHRILYYRQHSP